MGKAEEIIRIEGLSKHFGGKDGVTALEDIFLTVYSGEIFGIIGLSGAGKSTLVRCMNYLERPTCGTVRVAGVDLGSLSADELRRARRSIGMIFQQFNLLMQMTALENIRFPLLISGVPRAEATERARELLRLVELSEKESAYPAELSGGQQQRVAIARALANEPRVLLCDEATSALDPTTTRSILALLKRINREMGITIVVITHQMNVVEEICSRVAIIDASRIVETGPVEEIFRSPKSAAARRLLIPAGGAGAEAAMGAQKLRIAFDGRSAFEPVIASMVLSCGAPVNILYADMKTLGGKMHGQMVVQLPRESAAAERMKAFLAEREIDFREDMDYV